MGRVRGRLGRPGLTLGQIAAAPRVTATRTCRPGKPSAVLDHESRHQLRHDLRYRSDRQLEVERVLHELLRQTGWTWLVCTDN